MSKKKTTQLVKTEVLPKGPFSLEVDKDTPDNLLSPEQRGLRDLARESLISTKDAIEKYRNVVRYLRANHVHLRGTENKILIASGYLKQHASGLVTLALKSDKSTLDKYLRGNVGFQLALTEARRTRKGKAPTKTPKELAAEQEAKERAEKLQIERNILAAQNTADRYADRGTLPPDSPTIADAPRTEPPVKSEPFQHDVLIARLRYFSESLVRLVQQRLKVDPESACKFHHTFDGISVTVHPEGEV